ncbi:hypothetical protein Acr_28g0005710 [Actinidia rufa]|uniref:Retrotransposon gag domain-containing protein n=1 Tax=Actinidia rufa TaxID=165716 RepID=A0A7J0H9W6_9ERIC|nr:hypothetical protein Acr_28g0005710 [Actinidia rufa]
MGPRQVISIELAIAALRVLVRSPRAKVLSPPRPWARSHPMANPGQAPDLEGLHREIHDMAEQMRIMNENNGRLMQLLAAANPPLPAAPPIPDIERSRHSNRSGDRSQNVSANRVGRGRRQAPSSSLHEKSSSESSKTPTRQNHHSSKFKLPTQLGIYEGKTDPMDHLDSYKSLMLLQGCSDEVMCKAFSATLKGPARSWFRKLSPGTIDSFGDLSRLFVANFMSCRNRQKNASHLFTVHQKETESLKDFVKRFNQAILKVEDPSDKVIIMAMMEGLRPGPLFDSLSKNVHETLSALQSKADKYIAAEELAEAKRSNDDLRGLHLPHDDALVVSAVIANFNVQRILIDNGSSADILFISAFERMKVGLDKLHPFHTPLIGFGGNTTHPLGWINLPITLRTEPHQTTVWQDFIVVDCPSPYNAILGRPTLGGIKAITSTYHLKVKFPTPMGIGEIKGDQKVARQCFISAMKVETSSVPSTQ